jgi:hypothetical protein
MWEIKKESPWGIYTKIYNLKLDCWVTVAAAKGPSRKRVAVKSFSEPDSYQKVRMLYQIRHDNFVTVLESFSFEETFYVVLERMAITLDQIVVSPPYPSEQELAAILGQVSQADRTTRTTC